MLPLSELRRGSEARVTGRLRSVTYTPRETVPTLAAELFDGSAAIELVWLGRRRIAGSSRAAGCWSTAGSACTTATWRSTTRGTRCASPDDRAGPRRDPIEPSIEPTSDRRRAPLDGLREMYRKQLLDGLGGWSGTVIAAVPTVVFVVVNAIWGCARRSSPRSAVRCCWPGTGWCAASRSSRR